jgi:hypothetical protein
MRTPSVDAMRILRDEWEEMDEAGDHFSLDTPAHLLAYVRARAYEGAEEAWRQQTQALAMREMPLSPVQEAWATRQYLLASRLEVAYLRVLMSTIEVFAPAPQEAR